MPINPTIVAVSLAGLAIYGGMLGWVIRRAVLERRQAAGVDRALRDRYGAGATVERRR